MPDGFQAVPRAAGHSAATSIDPLDDYRHGVAAPFLILPSNLLRKPPKPRLTSLVVVNIMHFVDLTTL